DASRCRILVHDIQELAVRAERRNRTGPLTGLEGSTDRCQVSGRLIDGESDHEIVVKAGQVQELALRIHYDVRIWMSDVECRVERTVQRLREDTGGRVDGKRVDLLPLVG